MIHEEKRQMMELRHDALLRAREFTVPIVEDFPPETYEIRSGPTPPLSSPSMVKVTAGEQVVSMTLDVASWLMED